MLCVEITEAKNWRTNNTNRKPQRKSTKLQSKFSLILGYLNQALNNPALKRILAIAMVAEELFPYDHNSR